MGDDIDDLLLGAWGRLSKDERRARWAQLRRTRATMRRPPRAWCVCLRAADPRIEEHATLIELELNGRLRHKADRKAFRGRRVGGEGEPVEERSGGELAPLRDEAMVRLGLYPQRVVLTGEAIRKLTEAVRLRHWTPMAEAAQLLGVRDVKQLRQWVRAGRLECEHQRAPGGMGGPPRVVVRSLAPIDPNHNHGWPPDEVWGTAWQGLAEGVPKDFVQVFLRVAKVIRCAGPPRKHDRPNIAAKRLARAMGERVEDLLRVYPQMGRPSEEAVHWEWVCPGRLMRDAKDPQRVRFTGCGRVVRKLYLPAPVWTLADYLSGRGDAEADAELAAWRSPLWHVPKSFACVHCWKPLRTCATDVAQAWNLFVSHLSGGLLRGRDVPRPAGAMERALRHRYAHHPPRDDGLPLAAMPEPRFIEVTWRNIHLPPEERHLTLRDRLAQLREKMRRERREEREQEREARRQERARQKAAKDKAREREGEKGRRGATPEARRA